MEQCQKGQINLIVGVIESGATNGLSVFRNLPRCPSFSVFAVLIEGSGSMEVNI